MASLFRKNNAFEILSPSGWSNFEGIRKVSRNGAVSVETIKNKKLTGTFEHLVHDGNSFKELSSLNVGDSIGNDDKITSIVASDKNHDFFDAINVAKGQEYFTNDILSHNCQFLGSSGTLIAGWKLQQMEPMEPIADRANLAQFEKPTEGHVYVISADVSEGRGLDYSAFHVIDVTSIPYKQVAIFHDNMITPYDYGEVIYQTARSYNNAYILIETNGIGQQVSDTIYFDFEYEYLFVTEAAGRLGRKISSGFGAKVDRGVKTTKTVKATGCAITKLLIEQDKLIINDQETIFELSTFSRGDKKSYEAEEGKHDDLVMGIVLFGWLSDQSFFQELNDVNTLRSLREKTHAQVMDDLSPFGFIEDHNEVEHARELNDVSVGGDDDINWFGKKHGWNN